MLKTILLLLLSINVYALDTTHEQGISTQTKIVLGVVIIAGGVIAAPLIIPTATIAAVQTAMVAATAQVAIASTAVSTTVSIAVGTVAGPTIGTAVGTAAGALVTIPTGISVGIAGVEKIRPYVIATEEEELNQLNNNEIEDVLKAKTNFQNCLMKNKNDLNKNSFGCSHHCKETAYQFGLIAGSDELHRVRNSIQ